MPHAHATPARRTSAVPATSAPAVRLAPELTCPGCDRFLQLVQVRDGSAWLSCPRCAVTWLNLAVPRDAVPDLTLAARYGRALADALSALCDELRCEPLRPTPGRVSAHPLEPVLHVQLLGTRRIAHLHRYTPVADVWRVLERSRAALAKAG